MKHYIQFLTLLFIFIIHVNLVVAQDKIKTREEINNELKEYIFETTFWEPGYGVKLHNDESTKKLWDKYTSKESKCKPYADPEDVVHHIFSTEHLHIIVYKYPMWSAPTWLICDRDSGEIVYGSGWPENETYSKTMDNIYVLKNEYGARLDQSMCYDAPPTKPRFIRYHKDGPLMIKVLAEGCNYGKETHEVVLYFDENRVKPLPGSVVVELNTNHANKYGYFLRRSDKIKKTWNENGELVWTENIHVSIVGLGNGTEHDYVDVCGDEKTQHLYNCKGGNLQRPILERQCVFEQDTMRVTCEQKVLKRVKLKSFLGIDSNWFACDDNECHLKHKKRLLDKVDKFRELGFDISDETIEELEQSIETLKNRQ